jgi:hypothetical protein
MGIHRGWQAIDGRKSLRCQNDPLGERHRPSYRLPRVCAALERARLPALVVQRSHQPRHMDVGRQRRERHTRQVAAVAIDPLAVLRPGIVGDRSNPSISAPQASKAGRTRWYRSSWLLPPLRRPVGEHHSRDEANGGDTPACGEEGGAGFSKRSPPLYNYRRGTAHAPIAYPMGPRRAGRSHGVVG